MLQNQRAEARNEAVEDDRVSDPSLAGRSAPAAFRTTPLGPSDRKSRPLIRPKVLGPAASSRLATVARNSTGIRTLGNEGGLRERLRADLALSPAESGTRRNRASSASIRRLGLRLAREFQRRKSVRMRPARTSKAGDSTARESVVKVRFHPKTGLERRMRMSPSASSRCNWW